MQVNHEKSSSCYITLSFSGSRFPDLRKNAVGENILGEKETDSEKIVNIEK